MLREKCEMSEVREGVYRHFKGNLYWVICVAKHSETMEEMVAYCDITDEAKIWVRPISMWGEEVIADGEKQPRFRFLASSLDELDERPTFSLIEAIKDNMAQFRHNGEYNMLRFYHKPTSDILEVDEALLVLLEGGEDVNGFSG